MRSFRFRLDAALQLRRRQEEQAQTAMAVAARRLANERAHAEALCTRRLEQQRRRAALLQTAIDIQALVDADLAEIRILGEIEVQNQRVLDAGEEVGVRRAELQHCHAAREALERLLRRRLQEHTDTELAAEQQELDEIAVRKWRG